MNHRLFTSPTVIILLVALALLLLNSSVQGAQFNQAPPAPVAEPSPTALVSGLDANNSTTEEKIIAAPASCTGSTCTILSTAGWQQTPLTIQQGSPFNILYTSGSWTVDYRSFPYVGPAGYAPAVDSQITPGCKVDTMLPYAHLLGQIGSGPIFSIGMGGAFTANASGVLALRINDADSCLEDNDGALSLQTQTEFSCANVTEIPTSECNALVALYNSTNGPNWTNRSGWLTTIMPCSWSGVSCLNGHVYLLALLDNQLRGPLPTQLGDFPDMLAIYMSGNQLSGNIPTQLGNLTKLLDLDLGNNQLSGSIPAQLGNLPNLTHLYLNVNQLNGSIPPQLGNRTSLIALNLCCNQLSGNIPPQLGNLIGLRELTLSGNQLSGNIPAQLGNLANLTSLGLCCNQLNGNVPTQLGNLTKLTFLSLDANQLSGSLPTQLGSLVNLIEFHLENNQSLNGALPNSLTNLTKLATFWFHNTSLCEPGDSAFQSWLASIANLNRTGVCPANITVQFGAAAYTVNENGQVGGFQEVMLSAASSQPVTVQFATSNGTATAGSDYTATNATLTFNPGETSKSFNVPILQDNLDENDETVNLTLSNPANATLGTLANAALTIFDDDPLPTVQFSNATYSISENGGSATIQVTLSPVSGRTVAVNYATSNGTATAGSDYQARSGALTFNPGETSKTFTVSIINDNVVEPDETVNLTLSSPGNADLGSPANAILTILNEDETPCYTLTTSVNPSGAGSVAANPAPNCAGNQYAQGAAVTLSATPNAGFVFAAWSGSINSTANPVSVTMDGNKNITANFNPQPLSSISGRVADANNQPIAGVTVAAGAYTALTDTNGNYTLQGVAAGTYTVTPSKSGFTFFPPARSAAVPPNATGINFAGTQTPPSCYALVTSVNPGNWGTVVTTPAPNCQGNLYTQGAVVSLTATGNPGYEFVQWNGDANDVANPLSVTMDRNKSITANFRQAAFTCNNVTEIPRLECEALVAAYNSTNGPAWTNHSGWLVTLTPCSWFGVICGNNHVTELTLDANKLNGSIPTQLSNLTNLRVLDLNTNSLRGAIPGELGALANLEILDLSINYLNGAVPTQLTNLTRLTRLILGENELSGAIPPALGNLVNLVELSLDTNQLTGEIPSSLTSLTNLDTLYLSDNQLSGAIPAQLGNLARLTALGLDTNQLSGGLPAAVGSLVNLRYLYIDNNQLSGPLPGNLLNLTQLTFFAFHKTNLCEPADAAFQAWLAKFPASFRTNVQCVTADFTASPQSGNAPLTVAFHNSSIGSFTSCAWDYGDGATGNACTDHNHTYNAAGTYTVQLTVSGVGGTDTKARSEYITVAPPLFDAAELVAQGDYTTVAPGESVRIWINVRNSGNTTWRASDGYGWRGTGEWSGRSDTIWRDVPPGGMISFAEDVISPSQPGEYTYGFILQHTGQDFGPHFFIKVTVKLLPVVLVHGWNDTAVPSWDDYVEKFLPSIGLTGYAVNSLYTGAGGGAPLSIDENAQRLAGYIAMVKQKTGAKRVDIVAHSMGGLIARRYIAKYMNANTPDVNQLIMLGTPNAGSKTADVLELGSIPFALLEGLGIPRSFPSAKELTTDFVKQFNRDNPVPGNVRFYAIAGNYSCSPLTKLPPLNPIEPDPDDVVVWRESVFAIAEHGRWTYPSQQSGGCEGDHRGMRRSAANDGGQVIFSLFVSPLLRGQMPATPPELQTFANQTARSQTVANTLDAIQFTNVQTSTLQPGGRLEFSRIPEPGASVSFIVVGQPDQMVVSLRDPNGQVITPDTTDPNVQYMQMDKESMPITSYTISNPISGIWTTIVEANAQTPAEGVGVAAFGSLVSDLRLTLPIAGNIPVIHQTIRVAAQLQNIDTPVVGANVKAQLIFPNDIVTPIILLDDGLHSDGSADDGLYGYQFTPMTPGVYSALVSAEGVNGDITFQRSAVWATQVDGNQVFLPVVPRQ